MLSQVTQPLAPLLAFGSENAEFPAQGVEADVIGKVSTCFEISKCVQSSPTKTKNKQTKQPKNRVNKNTYVVTAGEHPTDYPAVTVLLSLVTLLADIRSEHPELAPGQK